MEGVEAGGPVRRLLKQMHLRDEGPEWEGPKVRTGVSKSRCPKEPGRAANE